MDYPKLTKKKKLKPLKIDRIVRQWGLSEELFNPNRNEKFESESV